MPANGPPYFVPNVPPLSANNRPANTAYVDNADQAIYNKLKP